MPDRWQRKFSAVRSAVRIGASGPGHRAEDLARVDAVAVARPPTSTSTAASSWANASVAHAVPASTPARRVTNDAVAAAPAGSSADVRSPSGARSSARARVTASRTARA